MAPNRLQEHRHIKKNRKPNTVPFGKGGCNNTQTLFGKITREIRLSFIDIFEDVYFCKFYF